MINWLALGFHAVWISGFALILASLNVSIWTQHQSVTLSANKFPTIETSLLLICLGLAGVSDLNWERILWIILTLAAVSFLIVRGIQR